MTDRDEFLDLYDRHRVEEQARWYRRRIDEYRQADRHAYVLQQVLLGSAAVAGLLAAVGIARQELGLVAALASVAAGLVAGWNGLMGFRQNADLYQAAVAGLAHTRPDRLAAAEPDGPLDRYVEDIESILLGEVRGWCEQWGEFVSPPDGRSS